MTGNCKALAALADEPGYVSMSPDDADARGVDEEQLVWVYSRRGKIIARVAVDERINDGAVYMTYQWWVGKCNELTIHATDSESGTPEDKYSACQVEAISDQAWAEQHLQRMYDDLKARLAAEADHQNPSAEAITGLPADLAEPLGEAEAAQEVEAVRKAVASAESARASALRMAEVLREDSGEETLV